MTPGRARHPQDGPYDLDDVLIAMRLDEFLGRVRSRMKLVCRLLDARHASRSCFPCHSMASGPESRADDGLISAVEGEKGLSGTQNGRYKNFQRAHWS